MKRIAIIGGGFGGIYTAMYLLRHFKDSEVKVTLINNNNYFLFTPMIHEVATGGLNRYNVIESIRSILRAKNFEFYKAHANKINFTKKTIQTTLGNVKYDYLVIAIGATTNFFHTPGAEKNALTLKSMKDASKIRCKIIDSFEKASKIKDPKKRRKLLTFIIIGAGPTGVELAGEITEFAHQIKEGSYSYVKDDEIKVYLVQRSDKIIPMAHPKCRADAVNVLIEKGVTILFNSAVTKIDSDYIEINKKNKLHANTIIWTSGVKPNYIATTPKIADDKNFFHVNPYLEVKKLKKVYAVGDVALFFNPSSNTPIPMLAQVATKQAKTAASNIIADINHKKKKPFIFKSSGFLVSLGQKSAVAEVLGFKFKGFLAWWFWRTIYLNKLVGFANKFRVAYDWTLNLFFKRDTSEI